MAKSVDAVIAALQVILQEAETREDETWNVAMVNQWIARLPGAWMGRWWHLKLRADLYGTTAYRDNLISHVRATLA